MSNAIKKVEWFVTANGGLTFKQKKTRAEARKFKNSLKSRGLKDAVIQRVEYQLVGTKVIR